jgi:uncharacterized protein YyaL (SSP411 family)
MVRLFEDTQDGSFWSSATDQEKLITRRKDAYDGAIPSGISVASMTLLRIAEFTDDRDLRAKAERAMGFFRDRLEQMPLAQPELLKGVSFLVRARKEIVISGRPGQADFEALAAAARRTWVPNRVIAFATGAADAEKDIPLLYGREPQDKARAFVCEGETCRQPVATVEELLKLLK